jgi:hypothetical protein
MFQPRVKLEFIKRYCAPQNGWCVCVDIDPSEQGRTGATRKTKESEERQGKMRADATRVNDAFKELGVTVGKRSHWCRSQSFHYLEGDPDVVAYNPQKKRCIVAEVEGESSGQPEQKLYKAIGQIVRTVSDLPHGWNSRPVIVVYGPKIAAHLQRARALAKLGISGVAIADDVRNDRWLFGEPLHAQ